jgi:hypothetical protein
LLTILKGAELAERTNATRPAIIERVDRIETEPLPMGTAQPKIQRRCGRLLIEIGIIRVGTFGECRSEELIGGDRIMEVGRIATEIAMKLFHPIPELLHFHRRFENGKANDHLFSDDHRRTGDNHHAHEHGEQFEKRDPPTTSGRVRRNGLRAASATNDLARNAPVGQAQEFANTDIHISDSHGGSFQQISAGFTWNNGSTLRLRNGANTLFARVACRGDMFREKTRFNPFASQTSAVGRRPCPSLGPLRCYVDFYVFRFDFLFCRDFAKPQAFFY